jgi:hypothetical protein
MNDLLLRLHAKLPTHTYLAVKLRASELQVKERDEYLEGVLRERERSEGAGE